MRYSKLSGLALPLVIAACLPDTDAPTAPVLTARAAATTETHGPPPPQDFGPDTYRTGLFTGQGITRPGLSCGASSARGRVCVGFLPSDVDGTLLDVSVMVPHGSGPHPLVTLLHGWGGSRSSLGEEAETLLADGYAVLRYSTRGFGDSWGQVNLADVDVEIADLRSMIGQVVDHRGFRLDADAVAVAGASYGGGHSWLALLGTSFTSPRGAAVRIRTVVPIATWSDLLYSLIPNGRPLFSLEPAGAVKLSYVNALYFSGIRTSPERPYPNYPDYLIAWHAWINSVEPSHLDPIYRQVADALAGYRSIWWQQDFWRAAASTRVPVFQVQGFTDDLFPLDESKRMLLALRSVDPGYPIASYFGDIGHPRAANKPGEVAYVFDLIAAWLDHYLKGSGPEPPHIVHAAITRPRSAPFDPADVITAVDYAALATQTIAKDFPGSATLINPLGDPFSGFHWDPLVMEAARELEPSPLPFPDPAVSETSLAVYEVPVSELTGGGPLLLAGQPSVRLRASSVAPRVQLNVRLIDSAPDGTRQLITRGTYTLDATAGDALAAGLELVIPTFGNVWHAAPDHVLRLEITNLDSPYITPSRVPSVTSISDVRLELPVR